MLFIFKGEDGAQRDKSAAITCEGAITAFWLDAVKIIQYHPALTICPAEALKEGRKKTTTIVGGKQWPS